jgi:hypothetical protein
MESTSYDNRLFLSLQALENDPILKVKSVAENYNVDRTTVSRRQSGQRPRKVTNAEKRKLTKLEEEAIVQRLLELDAQGFPLRISGVNDIANRLLSARDSPSVGKH